MPCCWLLPCLFAATGERRVGVASDGPFAQLRQGASQDADTFEALEQGLKVRSPLVRLVRATTLHIAYSYCCRGGGLQDYIVTGEDLMQEVIGAESTAAKAPRGSGAAKGTLAAPGQRKKFHRPKVIKNIFAKKESTVDSSLTPP